MAAFIVLAFQRWKSALSTFPSRGDWGYTLGLAGVLAALLLPLGFFTHFLQWQMAPLPPEKQLLLGALVFIAPALAEELVFRALLLPHPSENREEGTRLRIALGSLAAFVAYHPLKAALFLSHPALFSHPVFLGMAACLGGACTLVYMKSRSLWPSVLLHWGAVTTWLLFFGGYARL